jgi:dihydrofolate synthase/folylpolyglutamate synthase
MYGTDALHSNPALTQKLQRIYTLHRGKTVDLSFRAPYLNLLTRLGDPHLHLPPVIHVAGTNGKGSATAFMRAMLEAAGYRVHVYTSPHLVRFNERIVLAGQEIGDAELEALLDETMALNAGGALTFFEVTTAMAFAAFARHSADILLLEVGLGGRLDCTNLVPAPAATVIMPIGYDHMEFLGDRIEQIALEKAGIMKPGVPCVVAPQAHDVVMDILREVAAERGVPIFCHGAEWRIGWDANRRHELRFGNRTIVFPDPSLAGKHQIANAATAIQVLNVSDGFSVSDEAVWEGVTHAVWPGRLQRLYRIGNRTVPDDVEVWLDGGHNEDAARVLAEQCQAWQDCDERPLHLVVAMLNKRDPGSFLVPLLPYADTLTASAVPGESSSHAPDAIRSSAIDAGFDVTEVAIENDPVLAVQKLLDRNGSRILIAGSLYLVGAILKS